MAPQPVEIRVARPEDAAALAAYAADLFGERLPTMFLHDEHPDEAQQRRFIESFEPENARLIVAADGTDIVGLLGFHGHRRLQLRHAGVIGFSVKREYRRQGIGARMFEALFEWAWTAGGISRIECDVFSTNAPALALLESVGFEHEGTMRAAIEVEGRLIDNYLLARVERR